MSGSKGTRLVRPVERQGMKDWLTDKLDAQECYGLEWVDIQKYKFRIKWCHGSRQEWTQKETQVFEAWAKHTGTRIIHYSIHEHFLGQIFHHSSRIIDQFVCLKNQCACMYKLQLSSTVCSTDTS